MRKRGKTVGKNFERQHIGPVLWGWRMFGVLLLVAGWLPVAGLDYRESAAGRGRHSMHTAGLPTRPGPHPPVAGRPNFLARQFATRRLSWDNSCPGLARRAPWGAANTHAPDSPGDPVPFHQFRAPGLRGSLTRAHDGEKHVFASLAARPFHRRVERLFPLVQPPPGLAGTWSFSRRLAPSPRAPEPV